MARIRPTKVDFVRWERCATDAGNANWLRTESIIICIDLHDALSSDFAVLQLIRSSGVRRLIQDNCARHKYELFGEFVEHTLCPFTLSGGVLLAHTEGALNTRARNPTNDWNDLFILEVHKKRVSVYLRWKREAETQPTAHHNHGRKLLMMIESNVPTYLFSRLQVCSAA